MSRPEIELEIIPTERSAWGLFARHHYLSGELSRSAHLWVARWDSVPVACAAVVSTPGRISWWRGHRTVCLPDYQGLGIGTALSEWCAWLYSSDRPYLAVSAHPALTAHRARSPHWTLLRSGAHLRERGGSTGGHGRGARTGRGSQTRSTASFRWCGPSAPPEEYRAAMASLRCRP